MGSAESHDDIARLLRAAATADGHPSAAELDAARAIVARAAAGARARRRRRGLVASGAVATGVAAGVAVVALLAAGSGSRLDGTATTADEVAPAATRPAALALRPSPPGVQLVDPATGESTPIARPEELGTDTLDGAFVAGGWFGFWREDGPVHVGRIDDPSGAERSIALSDPLPEPVDAAPSLLVAPAGDVAWLVQPAIRCCGEDLETRIEVVHLGTGESLARSRFDDRMVPIGATATELYVNLWRTPGDAPTSGPSEVGVVDRATGRLTVFGPGNGVAAADGRVLSLSTLGNRLEVVAADGSRRDVAAPEGGRWTAAGGPVIPSNASPLSVVDAGGRALVGLGYELDDDGSARRSALAAVDLGTGTVDVLAEFDGEAPAASWAGDGRIVLVTPSQVGILDGTGKAAWHGIADEGHFFVGAG